MRLPIDWTFPTRTWRAGRTLWRVHRSGRSPWWFSRDGSGRFDPMGEGGLGACYLAEAPLGAFVETFRTRLELDFADVERMALARLSQDRDVVLADLCSRRALTYGVTAQLGVGGDYGASQAFAAAAARTGFGGVRWWVRHDPAQRLVGLALFGACGAREADHEHWPPGRSQPLGERLFSEARQQFGYRVVPRP